MAGSTNRRLSSMDAFFLYLERDTMPMHVGCVATFSGRIPLVRFKKSLENRLHLLPRYRQKVTPAPLGVSHPSWEDDPDFDIDNHIFEIALDKPGSDEQLRDLAGQIFEKPLDRDKPLWAVYIVRGLSGKRTGLICTIHHCMIDGVAGVGLLSVMFDTTPETPRFPKKPYAPVAVPGKRRQFLNALLDNAIDGLDHWSRFQRDLAQYGGGDSGTSLAEAVRQFGATMAGFLSPIKRLPFNKPFNGKRKLAWRQMSFAEARAIRSVCGGTFNDVVLAVLTDAVRRYAQHHGVPLNHRDFRILVPVNIRREEERGELGNRVTFLPVNIPLVVEDPIERLHVVTKRTQNLKKERVAEAISLMFAGLQSSIPPLQAKVLSGATGNTGQGFLRLLSQVPPLHMICTNVPGPQIPIYAVGKRLLEYYGMVPVAMEMGVTCAVTTYDQRMFVCFTADENAAPDVDKLMEFFDEAFLELRIRAEVEARVYVELGKRQKPKTAGEKSTRSISQTG
jgi:diacylglycerol O-acyltransferase / wax synthase